MRRWQDFTFDLDSVGSEERLQERWDMVLGERSRVLDSERESRKGDIVSEADIDSEAVRESVRVAVTS